MCPIIGPTIKECIKFNYSSPKFQAHRTLQHQKHLQEDLSKEICQLSVYKSNHHDQLMTIEQHKTLTSWHKYMKDQRASEQQEKNRTQDREGVQRGIGFF